MRRVAAVAAAAAATAAAATAVRCESSKKKKDKDPPPPKTNAELLLSLAARSRQVFLSGSIDDESAKQCIATLLHLDESAPGTPIKLHINSGGGKVQAGLAIHDVMQVLRSPVHTTCLGHCESMAAVLLASGAVGERAALANARIMIHQPVRSSGASKSNARQLSIQHESIEWSRLRLAELLAQRTGRPLAEIEQLFEYDHVCTATQALSLGLIDKVLVEKGALSSQAASAAEAQSHRQAEPEAPSEADS